MRKHHSTGLKPNGSGHHHRVPRTRQLERVQRKYQGKGLKEKSSWRCSIKTWLLVM